MASPRRVLDSLDLLPEECQDDVVWALARLNERSRSQADILFELNDRLAVKGHGPISKSAFSRRNVRLRRRRDRLEERNAMYAGIAETITPEKMAEQDIILGELIKTLIDELLDEASSAKEAMALATAYKQTVTAQHASADLRAKAEAAADIRLKKLAGEVSAAARKAGISDETMDAINRRLGIG